MKRSIWIVGAGYMGRSALSILANDLPTASFTVVDRDPAALAAAEELVPGRVRGLQADVSAALTIQDADLVVNLAGPFFTGSDTVARASVDAGSNYIDIADDIEGTRSVLALDAQARAAGVSLVTGAGLSPGVSNWLAGELLDAHPDADGIQVAWVVHESDPGGLAPLRHMLHMAVSPCPIWIDGELVDTAGFVPSTARSYSLPAPVGVIDAFDTAHPEPLTLSRAYPALRFVSCQGALQPGWANSAFSHLGRIGFGHSDTVVDFHGMQIEPAEFLWALMWKRYNARGERDRNPYTMVHVQALRGDTVLGTRTVSDDEVMARGTGLGAAAAALTGLESPAAPGASGAEALNHTTALAHFTRLAASIGGFRTGIVGT